MRKMVLLLIFALTTAVKAGELSGLKDNIWLYLPFDGALKGEPEEKIFEVNFGANMEDIRRKKSSVSPVFVKGKSGKAIELTGNLLRYVYDNSDFPVKEGSLMFWFRPYNSEIEKTGFLFHENWASFAVQMSGTRILAYYTSDHRKILIYDMKTHSDIWKGNWHFLVLNWKDEKRELYFNGKKVVEMDDVPVISSPTITFDLGFLAPGGGRKDPVGFANAAMDEVTILNRMLRADEVKTIWEEKDRSILQLTGSGLTIELPRKVFLRGEKIPVKLHYLRKGIEARISLQDENKKTYLLSTLRLPKDSFVIDTDELKPGSLRITAELIDEKVLAGMDSQEVVDKTFKDITIRQFKKPEFPVGIGGHILLPEKILDYYKNNHISFITQNGPPAYGFIKSLDEAYSRGIAYYPNLNIISVWTGGFGNLKEEPWFIYDEGKRRYVVNPERAFEYLQTLVPVEGKVEEGLTSSASPFSPVAWGMMEKKLREVMKAAGDHPGLQFVSFQDEVPLRTTRKDGEVYLGDYSFYALKHFEEQTGIKGPVWPPDAPEGTIFRDEEPYLKWMEVIGLPRDFTCMAFDGLYKKLASVVKEYRQDIIAVNYSGGEYGYLDMVGDWNYPYIWGPGLWGGGRGHGLLDYKFDLHRARQKVTPKKPLMALLGWWSADMSQQPDWWINEFRLNTVIALSKGVSGLEWFYPKAGETGYLSNEAGRKEFERWTHWLYKYGPVFKHLRFKEGGEVGVLWSETDRAGRMRKLSGWGRISPDITYTALRIAGATPYLVTDDMVKAGVLKDYDGLVLLDVDYSSERIWDEIKRFAASGKKVFYDATTVLYPEGAVPLKFRYDERTQGKVYPLSGKDYPEINMQGLVYQAEKIEEVLPETLRDKKIKLSNSDYVTPNWLYGGNGEYLFLINYNWKEGQKVDVSLKKEKGYIYNFLTGEKVRLLEEDGWLKWSTDVEPGGWSVFLISPSEIGGLKLTSSYKSPVISFSAGLKDKTGKDLSIPLPLQIKVVSPEGVSLPYTQPVSLDDTGHYKQEVKLSSLMDAPGRYRIEIEEVVTGVTAINEVNVTFKKTKE